MNEFALKILRQDFGLKPLQASEKVLGLFDYHVWFAGVFGGIGRGLIEVIIILAIKEKFFLLSARDVTSIPT